MEMTVKKTRLSPTGVGALKALDDGDGEMKSMHVAAARVLYERNGFETCPPFGDYFIDPHSVCYTRTLSPVEAAR